MRQFVVGDIHGAYKALEQCIERSGFKMDEDELIIIGDVADGWAYTKDCVDLLLKIKHRVLILGNHDQWLMAWYEGQHPGEIWTSQGGRNTQKSYGEGVPKEHQDFFNDALYFLEDDGVLFVHGGINPWEPMEKQNIATLLWDRDLIHMAALKQENPTSFKRVFVGHTTTNHYKMDNKPLIRGWLVGIDTGAGWEGKLTIMDTKTLEYWQSDNVADLYPNEKGRRG